MTDPQVAILGQYNWLPGEVWANPAALASVPTAKFGTPTFVSMLIAQPILAVSYEAPSYTYKSGQSMPLYVPGNTNLGTLHGAAPASGIYTGIPNGCGD